jgi:hypothetical protein
MSCVLVPRNKDWFKNNVWEIEDIWATIKKERKDGYEHRAPNRRIKKENAFEIMTKSANNHCLLQLDKLTGKITIIKKDIDNEFIQ